MIFKALHIFVFGFSLMCSAQNTKDVGFLRDMPYLKHAKYTNCDSTSGTTMETRICLNIQLRQKDSLMLSKFNALLNKIENDSLKMIFRKHQTNWEAERKSIGKLKSEGLENSAEANMYMYYMLKITEMRLQTLNCLLEENY